jgi:hypothetical protein
VDQEQVDVVEAERLERLVERPARVVGLVEAVVQLARDVDLVAAEARGANGLPHPLLVAVHLGGVDVAIARFECELDRAGGLGRGDLEDAEPQLRDGGAVVQLDRGNGAGRHVPECCKAGPRPRGRQWV